MGMARRCILERQEQVCAEMKLESARIERGELRVLLLCHDIGS